MNKKAQGLDAGLPNLNWFFVFVGIIFVVMIGLIIYAQITGESDAEEKCEKLDMELFEYSGGSLFTSSSITCWNPYTKETRIIK